MNKWQPKKAILRLGNSTTGTANIYFYTHVHLHSFGWRWKAGTIAIQVWHYYDNCVQLNVILVLCWYCAPIGFGKTTPKRKKKKGKDTQPSPISIHWAYTPTLHQPSDNSMHIYSFTSACIVHHIYYNYYTNSLLIYIKQSLPRMYSLCAFQYKDMRIVICDVESEPGLSKQQKLISVFMCSWQKNATIK